MLLSEFKSHLENLQDLVFLKPNGTPIPSHFHITEVGGVNKQFIDCGGTVRIEKLVSMQLWESIDVWHRLTPEKLLAIINLSIEKLGLEDNEIEIEYQGDTIGRYGVQFENEKFILIPKNTDCLANDRCGIPSMPDVKKNVQSACSPGSGCC